MRGGWRRCPAWSVARIRFRMLDHEDGHAPSIPALLAASEAVVMTSAQEGFGLPYLEAVAARIPLIARRLPNVVPDLESFGFRLPWLYDEVWVDPAMLNEKKSVIARPRRGGLGAIRFPGRCKIAKPALGAGAAQRRPFAIQRGSPWPDNSRFFRTPHTTRGSTVSNGIRSSRIGRTSRQPGGWRCPSGLEMLTIGSAVLPMQGASGTPCEKTLRRALPRNAMPSRKTSSGKGLRRVFISDSLSGEMNTLKAVIFDVYTRRSST